MKKEKIIEVKVVLEESDFFNWEPQTLDLDNQYASPIFCADQIYLESDSFYRSLVIKNAPIETFLKDAFWEQLYLNYTEPERNAALGSVGTKNLHNLFIFLNNALVRKLTESDINWLEVPGFQNFIKKIAQNHTVKAVALMNQMSPNFQYTYVNFFLRELQHIQHTLATAKTNYWEKDPPVDWREFKILVKDAFDMSQQYQKYAHTLDAIKSSYVPKIRGKEVCPLSKAQMETALSYLPSESSALFRFYKLDFSSLDFSLPLTPSTEAQILTQFEQDLIETKSLKGDAELSHTLGFELGNLLALSVALYPTQLQERLMLKLVEQLSSPYAGNHYFSHLVRLYTGSAEKYAEFIIKNHNQGLLSLDKAQTLTFLLLEKNEKLSTALTQGLIELLVKNKEDKDVLLYYKKDKNEINYFFDALHPTTEEGLQWVETLLLKYPIAATQIDENILEKITPTPEALKTIFKKIGKSYIKHVSLPRSWLSAENLQTFVKEINITENYDALMKKTSAFKQEDFIMFLLDKHQKGEGDFYYPITAAINKYALLAKNKKILLKATEVVGAESIYALEVVNGNKMTADVPFMLQLLAIDPTNYLIKHCQSSVLWENPEFALPVLELLEKKHGPQNIHQWLPPQIVALRAAPADTASWSELYKKNMALSTTTISSASMLNAPRKKKM